MARQTIMATGGESGIGAACACGFGADVAGPWTEWPTPFMPRENSRENWHLSTGSLVTDDPDRPVMVYKGATRDARWKIGGCRER